MSTRPQIVLATMAILQFMSVVLNLVPVPPLDGFQMLSPFLDPPTREKLVALKDYFKSIGKNLALGQVILTEGGPKKRAGVWLLTPEAVEAELEDMASWLELGFA